jgi:hypothetical protein
MEAVINARGTIDHLPWVTKCREHISSQIALGMKNAALQLSLAADVSSGIKLRRSRTLEKFRVLVSSSIRS